MNDNGGNALMVDGDDEDEDEEGEGAEMVDGDERADEDEMDMFSAADECVVVPLVNVLELTVHHRLAGDFGEVEPDGHLVSMELPFIGRAAPRGNRPPGFGASRLFFNGPPLGVRGMARACHLMFPMKTHNILNRC